MEADRAPYSLFFYTSPYKRSKQTHEEITSAFDSKHLVGAQEEVQLREQVRQRLSQSPGNPLKELQAKQTLEWFSHAWRQALRSCCQASRCREGHRFASALNDA